MERLTRKGYDGRICYIGCSSESCAEVQGSCGDCKIDIEAMKKLAEYEDLEEQRLLIKLPCAEGSTVYEIMSASGCDANDCVEFDEYVYDSDDCQYCEHYRRKYIVVKAKFEIQMMAWFGKTVFLTRTEAEEALKKMEGKEND